MTDTPRSENPRSDAQHTATPATDATGTAGPSTAPTGTPATGTAAAGTDGAPVVNGRPVTPTRQRQVRGALTRYSVMAYATGVMLLLLCVVMIVRYIILPATSGGEIPSWTSWVARIHGWLFIVYLVTCLDLGVKARWEPVKWLTTGLAGVIPVMSFIVERNRRREVRSTFLLDA